MGAESRIYFKPVNTISKPVKPESMKVGSGHGKSQGNSNGGKSTLRFMVHGQTLIN